MSSDPLPSAAGQAAPDASDARTSAPGASDPGASRTDRSDHQPLIIASVDGSPLVFAIVRAARVVACVLLGIAASALLSTSASPRTPEVAIGASSTIALLILLALRRWRRPTLFAAAFLAVGIVTVFSYTIAMASASIGDDLYFVSLVQFGLLLAGLAQTSPRSALAWLGIGLVAAEGARTAAVLSLGLDVEPNILLLVVASAIACAIVLISTVRTSARSAQARIIAASRDDRVSIVKKEIELQAAAFMHDTMLGHLAAISAAEAGALTEHARTQMTRDIDLLVGRRWMSGDPMLEDDAMEAWESGPIREAIAQEDGHGIDVTVSGDVNSVERMTIVQEQAVALAVRQSLVNVRMHAGVSTAEVVVLSRRDGVSVMVVDGGRGFDVAALPADRLGVRQSVRGRIEGVGGRVDIWSSVGAGTSVVMDIPVPVLEASIGSGDDGPA